MWFLKTLLQVTSLLGISVSATSTSNTTCQTRAPYRVQNQSLIIPDQYGVELDRNYTLEEHLQTIGLNLKEINGSYLRYWPESPRWNAEYLITIPIANSTIMDDVIRCDPGVKSVYHDLDLGFKIGAYFHDSQSYTDGPKASRDLAASKSYTSNISCETRAPYRVQNQSLIIPNLYTVELNRNYTLEKHFQTIGLNLSEINGSDVRYFPESSLWNAEYFIELNDSTIMDDIIRCDPGIKSIRYAEKFFVGIEWIPELQPGYNATLKHKQISWIPAASKSDTLSTSCIRAPYKDQLENPSFIRPDRYVVDFVYNYTLEEHFRKIGLNLREIKGSDFRYFPGFPYYSNTYHIKLDNSTIMDDIIRCDPGVKSVSHDTFDPTFGVPDLGEIRKEMDLQRESQLSLARNSSNSTLLEKRYEPRGNGLVERSDQVETPLSRVPQ